MKRVGSRQDTKDGATRAALSASGAARFRRLPVAGRLRATAQVGFTLLELMIVISIIIVLAVIVLPQYMRTVQQARESVLRDDLFQMRKMIDQYAADKGKLPQSVDDLVSAGYLREMPVDPMTGRAEWNQTTGGDPNSADNSQGLTDVHSFSTDTALDGSTTYDQW
ncbi:MAG TPA: prepilin-type N-terminal cleavage/methylation domain-containing protein [Pyrinomonadaceae bacterium]|nr:prepilin-type N-terminal cleavage/methylation domain-containing protein [Pyrinomonadaceae bacterium]